MTTQVLTAANLEIGLPIDMGQEVSAALLSGREEAIEYVRNGGTHYVYFPSAGRGGVCQGGNTDWTDCDGINDLADRWANYESRWSN